LEISRLKSEVADLRLSLILTRIHCRGLPYVSPVAFSTDLDPYPDDDDDTFYSDEDLARAMIEADAMALQREVANGWRHCHFLTVITTRNQSELDEVQRRVHIVAEMRDSLRGQRKQILSAEDRVEAAFTRNLRLRRELDGLIGVDDTSILTLQADLDAALARKIARQIELIEIQEAQHAEVATARSRLPDDEIDSLSDESLLDSMSDSPSVETDSTSIFSVPSVDDDSLDV
jgi:hypothetical protein